MASPVLDIIFCGKGVVAERCLDVLLQLGFLPRIVCENPVGLDIGKPDLLLSVHCPALFSKTLLSIPKIGCLNLHNSFLPWNKGAHACTWAIVDDTPHGATLHWIDEGVDTGDIFFQKELFILDHDTADSLYRRTVDLEISIFEIGIKRFIDGDRTRIKQNGRGSFHGKKDITRLIRALTTSDIGIIYKT